MQKKQNHWMRQLAALVCLVAVLLLQAPFARASWLAVASNCCMGDHCPIPGHHHKTQPAKEEMPMDCGHDMSKMSDCKIYCCKTIDETAINIEKFVMPDSQIALPFSHGTPESSRFVPQMISRFDKPQSPPPRLFPS